MRDSKLGNSLPVRLPESMVQVVGLKSRHKIGSRLSVARDLKVTLRASRDEILARLRAFRGTLPADFKFDRNEANGR